ncbi:hypothetical protein HF086_006747 [Spodoptera exigua]|uniref:Uncharacterized protein n=1 Tax=Spodoptera exigua TaxID=7107 RepID=A0A922M6D9_SPOEX|nr:hypothetical protein HF086_006747 [Spodoptera exigua]
MQLNHCHSKVTMGDSQETLALPFTILKLKYLGTLHYTKVSIMTRLTLEGDTLGKKRQLFNNLVADAVTSKHYGLTPINYTDSDLDNLLKIEIACKNKNVDYVIEVMKSKDMLYASTAIKKSTWLITDPQYANIINPEYLHTQLKPYMTTKAFNKLMLHIRLNLKDESRVETFMNTLKKQTTRVNGSNTAPYLLLKMSSKTNVLYQCRYSNVCARDLLTFFHTNHALNLGLGVYKNTYYSC